MDARSQLGDRLGKQVAQGRLLKAGYSRQVTQGRLIDALVTKR